MRIGAAVMVAWVLGQAAWAQNAQDELERQLREMVGKPPTKLLVEFEGLDQPNYKIAEAAFELDGSKLPTPALTTLDREGKHLIFHGDVKPGRHSLVTTLALKDVAGVLFSYEAGFTFRLKKEISFDQQPGLEVHVVVVPDLNPSEKDAKKKFTLKSNTTLKMLAKLEDGTMPEPPKPNLPAPEVEVDAGTPAPELTPAEKAKAAKLAAAEEAKRKKEEAAAAKALAAEEAKRKKEEAAAAKALAAQEAKRKKEEAAAAKALAAEEAKRKAREAAEARQSAGKPTGEPTAVAAAGATPGSSGSSTPGSEGANGEAGAAMGAAGQADGGVAEVAPVDAGSPVAVVAAAPTPPRETKPPPAKTDEGGGLPLPILLGVGVALLGLIILLVTRRRSPPPPG